MTIGKCIIIDDVLSGGGTITQMKEEIENAGGVVLEEAPTLSNKLGMTVIDLVTDC